MNFADTNWLEALYFDPHDREHKSRCDVVERFMRKEGGPLCVSHMVYLEARNVFSRVAGVGEPEEWRRLKSDLNTLLHLDPMNWEALRRESFHLFAKYSSKAAVGTFDITIIASFKLSGATRLLSFDETLKAVAVAERIAIYPPLLEVGKRVLSKLKASPPHDASASM